MFFTDPLFLAVVLPSLVILFRLAGRHSRQRQVNLLLAASILLYGWTSPCFLPLMFALVLFNVAASTLITSRANSASARRSLALAVAVDLGVLAYYKYKGAAFGAVVATESLPLGISFVTITLVVYLVQAYRSGDRGQPTGVAFVAMYFPHLAAGPILNYRDIAIELSQPDDGADEFKKRIVQGSTLIVLGLAKKLFVANAFAPYADFAFTRVETGPISLLFAWMGALAYTFQLYFDFSAYSDMALGISLLFGIRLPINFDSPYKATSLIEFWRRWHMSLSRVLRDFVYIPLGGSRKGELRKYTAILATMVIGGAWHGATVNFWLWGGYHGLLLCVAHWWLARSGRDAKPKGHPWLGRLLTLLAVIVGWVMFRAASLDGLIVLLQGMAGRTGLYTATTMSSASLATPEFVTFNAQGLSLLEFALLLVVFGWVVLRAPNSNQLAALMFRSSHWNATWRWGIRCGLLLVLAMGSISTDRGFLYVNF